MTKQENKYIFEITRNHSSLEGEMTIIRGSTLMFLFQDARTIEDIEDSLKLLPLITLN